MAPLPAPLAAPSKKRFDRERHFALVLDNDTTLEMPGSRFVQHIIGELQQVFDKIAAPSDDIMRTHAELANLKISCQRDGLYALRRICTVWAELPKVGTVVHDAVISSATFSFAAHGVMENKGSKAMQWQIAKLLSGLASPPDDEVEAYPRSQQRMDDCLTAMKMQYQVWLNEMLQEGNFSTIALDEDEPDIKFNNIELTYTPLSEPSTAAQMMSSIGLAEAAKEEQHETLLIYVSGKVLKTKSQKGADTQDQVLAARAAEAAEATRAKEEAAVDEPLLVGSSKRKRTADDGQGDASKSTPKHVKAQPRKRKTATPANNEDSTMADADGSPVAQPPKKRDRKPQVKNATAPGKSEHSTGSPNSDDSSNGPTGNGTVAPHIKKPGGAATKWLADEDDLLHQIVDNDHELKMPDIYRKWAAEMANTAYQSGNMETHGYRSDYIPFDRVACPMDDKESREFDIAPRTYQSVRQRIESYKAWVNKKPHEREAAEKPHEKKTFPANPVVHLPKRSPPPRPDFFSDGKTRVPPAPRSFITYASTGVNATRVPGIGIIIVHGWKPINQGWTPINNPSSGTFTPYQAPAPTRRRAKAKSKKSRRQVGLSPEQVQEDEQEGEQNTAAGDMAWVNKLPVGGESAPGDALVDTIEDFVAQQCMGEDVEADEEMGENMETGEEHALDESGFEPMKHTMQRIHDMENTPRTSRPAKKCRPAKSRSRRVIRPGDYDISDEEESSMREPSEAYLNPFEAMSRFGQEVAQRHSQLASSKSQSRELTADRKDEFSRTKAAMIEAGSWGGPCNQAPYVPPPAAQTVGAVEEEAGGDQAEALEDVASEADGVEQDGSL